MQHIIKTISPIAVLLIFVAAVLLRKRKKGGREKDRFVLLLGIAMMPCLILSVMPFENSFISFGSAESAHGYFSGKGGIVCVDERDGDVLVVSMTDKTFNTLYLYKSSGRYKAPPRRSSARVVSLGEGYRIVRADVPCGSKAWFIVITSGTENVPSAEDTLGNTAEEFHTSEKYTYSIIFADKVDKDYALLLDGERVYPKSSK